MDHPFVRKLRQGAQLGVEDEAALLTIAQCPRNAAAHTDILAEGAEPRFLPLIIDGWACRYRLLENGKRQILSLFLPGDLCGAFGALPRRVDHPLAALTPV